MGELWVCEWCGANLEPLQTGWTDIETGSGEFCPEGQAVRDWGTSPHLPIRASPAGHGAVPQSERPEVCQCGHTREQHESRYNAPNHCTHRCAPPWIGRAVPQSEPPVIPDTLDIPNPYRQGTTSWIVFEQGQLAALDHLRQSGAVPQSEREGLDVPRLAKAIDMFITSQDGFDVDDAEAIADLYVRLASPAHPDEE